MQTPDFSTDADVDAHVERYRNAIAERDKQTTPEGRDEWIVIAMALRQQWREFSGDDDLHEQAFGEPEE